MKRTHASSFISEVCIKAGLIAAIAAACLAPTSVKVHGAEDARPLQNAAAAVDRSPQALPLPPIQYLETMRWLEWPRSPGLFRTDVLIRPVADDNLRVAGSTLPRS